MDQYNAAHQGDNAVHPAAQDRGATRARRRLTGLRVGADAAARLAPPGRALRRLLRRHDLRRDRGAVPRRVEAARGGQAGLPLSARGELPGRDRAPGAHHHRDGAPPGAPAHRRAPGHTAHYICVLYGPLQGRGALLVDTTQRGTGAAAGSHGMPSEGECLLPSAASVFVVCFPICLFVV